MRQRRSSGMLPVARSRSGTVLLNRGAVDYSWANLVTIRISSLLIADEELLSRTPAA